MDHCNLYTDIATRTGGDIYIGAMTVINSVREVMTMPANGITGGAQPVLGYHYGAKEFGRVKKGSLFTTGICVTYTLVAWGVVFLFPHELIRIFNDNPQLVDVGARIDVYKRQAPRACPMRRSCAKSTSRAGTTPAPPCSGAATASPVSPIPSPGWKSTPPIWLSLIHS